MKYKFVGLTVLFVRIYDNIYDLIEYIFFKHINLILINM